MIDETFISSKEHLQICVELHREPSLTLEKIESQISNLQEEIFESEKAYLRQLDNKQYQKTLIERKGAKENNNHFISLFGHLDEEIKTLIAEHNEQIDKLKGDLLYRKKMKKIYMDMYPVSQKGIMSPRTTSPRLGSGSTTPRSSNSTSILPSGIPLGTFSGTPSGTSSGSSVIPSETPPKISPRITTETIQETVSPALSPRNSYREESSNSGTPGSGSASPRITKLLKSNSFLKRSIDLVLKGKSSS